MREFTCQWCGTVAISNARVEQKYCSKECKRFADSLRRKNIGSCLYNPEIICSLRNCENCGWNPEVEKKRKETLGV